MTEPLCLIGMSGVGKSFWAKRLAAAGFARYDCDADIAAHLGEIVTAAPKEELVHALGRWMGMPHDPGYAEREARYLALEEAVTRAALSAATAARGPSVIDTTGSVIYLPGALLAALRAECRVVYLRSPEARRAAMLARYVAEPKPVVWGGAYAPRDGERPEDALSRCFAELLALRDARYAALAHVTLDGGALELTPPDLSEFLARCYAP